MSVQTAMNRSVNFLLVLLVLMAAYVAFFHSDWIIAGRPKVNAQSILRITADTECMGGETAQQCAARRYGAPVYECRPVPGECPYGDSLPPYAPERFEDYSGK